MVRQSLDLVYPCLGFQGVIRPKPDINSIRSGLALLGPDLALDLAWFRPGLRPSLDEL